MEYEELIKERISINKDLIKLIDREIKFVKKHMDYLDDGLYDSRIEKMKIKLKQLRLQKKSLKIKIMEDENLLD